MLASQVPANFPIPFGNSAGIGFIHPIPVSSQIGITPGAASLTDGFVPLNFLAVIAGGIPPDGRDMNGILYEATAAIQWSQVGGIPFYDSAFSTAIGGYPDGAVLQSLDKTGFWRSTVDNNTADPDTNGANWLPHYFYGLTDVTMTNTDVVLTLAQYSKPIIAIYGALLGNLNLVFPNNVIGQWVIQNNTSGPYTITAKTVSGTGPVVNQGTTMFVFADGVNLFDSTSSSLTETAADLRYALLNGNPINTFDVAPAVGSTAAIPLGQGDSRYPQLSDFAHSILPSGYQRLSGGLIIQWGLTSPIPSGGTGALVNFPLGFPAACFIVVPAFTDGTAIGTGVACNASNLLSSSFRLSHSRGSDAQFFWVAIGN